MKLVPNVKEAYKWFSVQIMAVIAFLPVAYYMLPEETLALIPDTWKPWVVTVVAIAGIIGRVVDQSKKT